MTYSTVSSLIVEEEVELGAVQRCELDVASWMPAECEMAEACHVARGPGGLGRWYTHGGGRQRVCVQPGGTRATGTRKRSRSIVRRQLGRLSRREPRAQTVDGESGRGGQPELYARCSHQRTTACNGVNNPRCFDRKDAMICNLRRSQFVDVPRRLPSSCRPSWAEGGRLMVNPVAVGAACTQPAGRF